MASRMDLGVGRGIKFRGGSNKALIDLLGQSREVKRNEVCQQSVMSVITCVIVLCPLCVLALATRRAPQLALAFKLSSSFQAFKLF
jgi:hypothetical protein